MLSVEGLISGKATMSLRGAVTSIERFICSPRRILVVSVCQDMVGLFCAWSIGIPIINDKNTAHTYNLFAPEISQ